MIWQNGQYSVVSEGGADGNSIYYNIGNGDRIQRVEADVVAVGVNENYLVAKRLDKYKCELFYYIEISKDGPHFNEGEITKGPFRKQDFINVRERLGLPSFDNSLN